MNESNHYMPCASLAALGRQFQQLGLWQVIAEHVRIHQITRMRLAIAQSSNLLKRSTHKIVSQWIGTSTG